MSNLSPVSDQIRGTPPLDRKDRVCVLGAGSSGLTVAKNLAQRGIAFDCLERLDDVGGNWYFGQPGSSVYRSVHLISSKRLTEYVDFPMPREYPAFPSQQQAWEYLRSYARRFGLYERIEFQTPVRWIDAAAGGWLVELDSGQQRLYGQLVIANGHNWDPRFPEYPGHFSGLALHSAQYKTPDVLRDKRVLVVGAGNSGCDIAVESTQVAARTLHSARRGYHYLPKFLLGRPVDQCGERLLRWRLPLWARRWIAARLVRLAMGRPEDYGLAKPDHQLFETHPIINSQMLYLVGHGQIAPKPDVAQLRDDAVQFVDGSVEPIDVIIYATGFKLSFPFIDPAHLDWHAGRPKLFLNVFHPRRDDLFVAGLIQPDSGQWGLVDRQAQLIGEYLLAQRAGRPSAQAFRRRWTTAAHGLNGGIRYVDSPRHALEVEHFSYARKLESFCRMLRN